MRINSTNSAPSALWQDLAIVWQTPATGWQTFATLWQTLAISKKHGLTPVSAVFAVWLLFFVSVPPNALAQRGLKDIPDPDPAVEQATFQLAPGWEANLFASDPMIAKPIQLSWDMDGRLWIAGSRTYPQIEPGASETDQIIVIEDTDGDGAADTRSVFAEGLLIPTGVLPGDGGVYIANSTELLHLRDTDGDNVADEERVVLSGFGTEDTHHILHGLRWAPGGQLMMMQSIYIHSHIETPHGPRRMLAGGVWELKPHTLELNIYNRGLVNSWGLRWNRHGQTFQTDGAGGNGINYTFPGTLMQTARGAPKVVPGLNPGQPKHCGLEILSGDHIPDEWQGRFLTADFRGNRVNSFALERDATGWISRKQEDIIQSTSVAFRPVDISQGPDGAIYIADWYNPIIQHGEVDFRDERRDQTHGRIWRISATGRDLDKSPKLDTPQAAFAALESSSSWTRDMARQKLRAAGPSVLEMLDAWQPRDADIQLEKLWVYQGIDQVTEPALALLDQLLAAEKPEIRAAATRVLSSWSGPGANSSKLPAADTLSRLKTLVTDADIHVRHEALHVARALGSVDAVKLALAVADQPRNRFVDFSLWRTLHDTRDAWVPAMTERPETFGGVAQMLTAMEAIGQPVALPGLMKRWKAGELSSEQEGQVLGLLAEMGDAKQLAAVYNLALEKKDPALLDLLHRAATRKRPGKPVGDLERLNRFLTADDATLKSSAMKLAGAWRLKSARVKLEEAAGNLNASQAALAAVALEALPNYGREALPALRKLTADDQPIQRRLDAVRALTQVAVQEGAKQTAVVLGDCSGSENFLPAVDAVLGTKAGPAAFEKAMQEGTLSGNVAAACVRRIDSSGRRMDGLKTALQKAGGLQPIFTKLEGAKLDAFLADVGTSGSPERGEKIYHRASLQCVRCHAIAGSGGLIGPDISSIGASAPVDYLLESMLEPSVKIKEGYHTLLVTQNDAKVAAGTVVREGTDEVVIRDAAGVVRTIPTANIAKKEIMPQSLMPAGLTAQLRRDELVDLVAFMSKLGKTGGLVVPPEQHVRTWRMLRGGKEVNDDVRHKDWPHAAADNPLFQWDPKYSRVDGHLPISELGAGRFGNIGSRNFFFVTFELEVEAAGPVTLNFNDPLGLRLLYQGNKLVPKGEGITLKLSGTGRQSVLVAIEERVRNGKALSVVLAEQPGSSARVRLVGGP